MSNYVSETDDLDPLSMRTIILKRPRNDDEERSLQNSLSNRISKLPHALITAKNPKIITCPDSSSTKVKEELPDTNESLFILNGIKVENDGRATFTFGTAVKNDTPSIELHQPNSETTNKYIETNIPSPNLEINIKQKPIIDIKQECEH